MEKTESVNKENHMVNIGEIKITSNANEIIWSVLGSCISVIFHVTDKKALICHAQMPVRKEFGVRCTDSCPKPCFSLLPDSMELRFVNCAIEYMINYLKRLGTDLSTITTTLIGGASKLKDLSFSIGDENLKTARETLARHNIKINRSATSGDQGYTFWYRPADDRLIFRRHKNSKKEILPLGQHIEFPI